MPRSRFTQGPPRAGRDRSSLAPGAKARLCAGQRDHVDLPGWRVHGHRRGPNAKAPVMTTAGLACRRPAGLRRAGRAVRGAGLAGVSGRRGGRRGVRAGEGDLPAPTPGRPATQTASGGVRSGGSYSQRSCWAPVARLGLFALTASGRGRSTGTIPRPLTIPGPLSSAEAACSRFAASTKTSISTPHRPQGTTGEAGVNAAHDEMDIEGDR